MVDAGFAELRLAAVYDPLERDRTDLDTYVAMVKEFGARSILDIGCGTGTLACRLGSAASRSPAWTPPPRRWG